MSFLEVDKRLKYIKWVESMPYPKNTKNFLKDDYFFWCQLQKGLLYEKLVAQILRDYGIKEVYVAGGNSDSFRKNLKDGKKYTEKSRDMVIKGRNFEVKSRNIFFKKPLDWPKKLSPVNIDTVSGYQKKKFDVSGYIMISQKTGRIMAIPTDQMIKHKKYNQTKDRKRNMSDKFISVDPHFFDSEEEFVQHIKSMK